MFEKNKNLNSTLSLKLLKSFGRFQKYIKLDIKINTDLPQDKNVGAELIVKKIVNVSLQIIESIDESYPPSHPRHQLNQPPPVLNP